MGNLLFSWRKLSIKQVKLIIIAVRPSIFRVIAKHIENICIRDQIDLNDIRG